MHLVGLPLLVLGFALGAAVYALVGYALVSAARTVVTWLLILYWQWRTHREANRQHRRVARVQRRPSPPARAGRPRGPMRT